MSPTVIQRFVRPAREDRLAEKSLLAKLDQWLAPDAHHYLGFGGTGDALLLLAACWDDPKARAVFFANGESLTFVQQFFTLFNIPVLLQPNIMGRPWAGRVYDRVTSHPGFRPSAHLADGLNYGDWADGDKYARRLVTRPPWRERFGGVERPRTVVIAPAGSDRTRHRQRFLEPGEFDRLVKKYVGDGADVLAVGSEANFKHYGLPHQKCLWLTSDTVRDSRGVVEHTDLADMLRLINGADQVVSMDTWLKTYAALVGLPTTVIATRWDGRPRPYGADATDFIFLNPRFWPTLTVTPFEHLV